MCIILICIHWMYCCIRIFYCCWSIIAQRNFKHDGEWWCGDGRWVIWWMDECGIQCNEYVEDCLVTYHRYLSWSQSRAKQQNTAQRWRQRRFLSIVISLAVITIAPYAAKQNIEQQDKQWDSMLQWCAVMYTNVMNMYCWHDNLMQDASGRRCLRLVLQYDTCNKEWFSITIANDKRMCQNTFCVFVWCCSS